jgi:O-antigen biosynthesis protein WbqP
MKNKTPQISSNDLENPELYVLKVGRFARKFSIDELPNLINIVRGEMNFIGPRPLMPTEIELLLLREQHQINKMKPGITGYAQINGRDHLTIHEKVQLEKFYLQNKSIFLDIKIIIQTIFVVFRAAGVRF